MFRVNSVIALKYAIQSGIGIGMLPEYMTEEETDLVPLLEDAGSPSMDVLFVYPEELKTSKKVHVDVEEVSRPEVDAQLVAEGIAQQVERRISYKRAMKQAVQRAVRFGAEGVMITCGGRLHGAEMARKEQAPSFPVMPSDPLAS